MDKKYAKKYATYGTYILECLLLNTEAFSA